MYRDLYSAICAGLCSARRRQGENEEERGSPWSASAADPGRIEKRRWAGQPPFFISRAGAQNYQAFTLYIMRFAKRVQPAIPVFPYRLQAAGGQRAGDLFRAAIVVRGKLLELRMIVGVAAGLGLQRRR